MLLLTSAKPGDAPQLASLGQSTFTETFSDLFVNHASDLASYLAATFSPAKIALSMAQSDNRFWIVRQDGQPVGYAKLKLGSAHPAVVGRRSAQLQKIYVLRTHLGTGAGKLMLDEVMGCASDANCDRMWLTVLESNDRAIGFYLRNRWISCAKDTHWIGAQSFVYDVLTVTIPAGSKVPEQPV